MVGYGEISVDGQRTLTIRVFTTYSGVYKVFVDVVVIDAVRGASDYATRVFS